MSHLVRAAGALVAAVLALAMVTTPARGVATPAGPPGLIQIVQAVPRQTLAVAIDGKTVDAASTVGAVLGPFSVSPGSHRVEFTDASGKIRLVTTLAVASGSSSDVVVHLPASPGGAPIVNSYRTPRGPIGPGKARVLIAHTATVAPADVRVDGQVVFHDIANGEYATADLAAGSHTVALLPAGLTTHPILGPLHVDLVAGTVTMVYAVGNPRDSSMNVIAHSARLSSNGAVVPSTIDTGRAGLVAGLRVHPFRVEPATASPRSTGSWPGRARSGLAALVLLAAVGLIAALGRPSRMSRRPR
jgi:hypothetical protein